MKEQPPTEVIQTRLLVVDDVGAPSFSTSMRSLVQHQPHSIRANKFMHYHSNYVISSFCGVHERSVDPLRISNQRTSVRSS